MLWQRYFRPYSKKDRDKLVMVRTKYGQFYIMQLKVEGPKCQVNVVTLGNNKNIIKQWHHWFGHVHFDMIKKMQRNVMVARLNISNQNFDNPFWIGCAHDKNHRQSFLINQELQKVEKLNKFYRTNIVVLWT